MSLTNEDVQKIGKLFDTSIKAFWEETAIPWLETNFVSKEDLDFSFEKQLVHISEEFQLVRVEISNLDSKVNRLTKRVDDVDGRVISLQKSHLQLIEETKRKFSAHTDQFRKMYGVSESLPTYQVEEKPQK